MQQIPIEVIWLVAAAILIIIGLIYQFKFDKPARMARERLRGLYYETSKFKARMVTQTFTYYDEKISKLVLSFCVPAGVSVVIPAMLIPPPYNFIISMSGVFVSFLLAMLYKRTIDEAERTRNINKPFGSSITYYPGEGDNPEFWRRMEVEYEVMVNNAQREIIVDQLIETAKELPSFDPKEFTAQKLEKVKKEWMERLQKFHTYRMKVDDFIILFITPHELKNSTTPGTKPVIDETVHVDVNLIPMFSMYAGTTRKVFASRDKKDRPNFIDRTMGIYVNLYDIKSRDDDLLEGGHVALTKTDALLGEALHLFEQRQSSAKEMTKTLRDLEKSNQDYEDKKFDTEAEVMGDKIDGMLGSLLVVPKPGKTTTDYLLMVVVFIVGLTIGVLIMSAPILIIGRAALSGSSQILMVQRWILFLVIGG